MPSRLINESYGEIARYMQRLVGNTDWTKSINWNDISLNPGDTININIPIPPSITTRVYTPNTPIRWDNIGFNHRTISITVGDPVSMFASLMESDPTNHIMQRAQTHDPADSFGTMVRVDMKCWFSELASRLFNLNLVSGVAIITAAMPDGAMMLPPNMDQVGELIKSIQLRAHTMFIDKLAIKIDSTNGIRRFKPCRAIRPSSGSTTPHYGLRSPYRFALRLTSLKLPGIKERAKLLIEQRRMKQLELMAADASRNAQAESGRSWRESRRRPLQEEYARAQGMRDESMSRAIARFRQNVSTFRADHQMDAMRYAAQQANQARRTT